MISLDSWWRPKRPARIPRPGTAWLVAGVGAALFGVSALVLMTGTRGEPGGRSHTLCPAVDFRHRPFVERIAR